MKTGLLPRELGNLATEELFVNEFFISVQGEASYSGRACFFIRLTGCHLRCEWCDTEYAFHEGQRRTVEECLKLAHDAGCKLVEVTGGEPLLQKAVYPLLSRLCDEGFEVLLETSGALPIDQVDSRVSRIVDWKTPASGMAKHNNSEIIDQLRDGDELKVVVRNREDYEWTRDWLRETSQRFPDQLPVWLSPVFGELSPDDLVEWIQNDDLDVRLNLQLHKYIWDPQTRGV